MIKEKEIRINTEYGAVNLKLKEFVDKRGLNMYQVSKKTGIKYDVIYNYYHNRVSIYHSDILAKLCYVLDCKINAIIEYEVDK